MTDFVNVAVPRPVWQTFTYALPEELSGGSLKGCRVLVPFGAEKLVGFVWDTEGDFRTDPEPRRVMDRLDSTPPLPEPVMELVEWAQRYYHAAPGMMISSALPPGMSGRATRKARLKREPSGDDVKLYDGILRLLDRRRAVSVSSIRKQLGGQHRVDEELASLESRGILETWWEPAGQASPLREYYVRPADGDATELTRLAERLRSIAPRQAEVLAYLSSSVKAQPRREVMAATGASYGSIQGLVRRGLVRLELRELSRLTPREDEDGSGLLSDSGPEPELTGRQSEALSALQSAIAGSGKPVLLHGVTGSGKTEVYMRAIASVLRDGGSALVLVPEISLTPLAVARFRSRFPDEVAVLHSGMSSGERLESWNSVRNGSRRIVVGPRSAVFSPLRGTRLIVVDEEHDGSYKQAEQPHYNARDMAIVRGRLEGAAVVLGSASPSLESYCNAVSGRFQLLELPERVDSRPMPEVLLVGAGEMKDPLLSDELLAETGKRTSRGEQAIILINRRGFAPSRVCRNCGDSEGCPRCGIALTYHRRGETLRCHHCDFWMAAPVKCGKCGNDSFSHLGPGIQKVEAALARYLPGTRVIRMDSDTTRGRRAHWELLRSFGRGEGDVLLGTQMVAKGHDFPNVTLVGVIAADMGLSFPDFRASERTFQLLLQVAGRAGRGGGARSPGKVILQAFDTSSSVLNAASKHDYSRFWNQESELRRKFHYPPYAYLVRLLWSGLDEKRVGGTARSTLQAPWATPPEEVEVFPPGPAVLPRVNRNYRWASLARSMSRQALYDFASRLRTGFEQLGVSSVRLDVDVDPYDML